jgi:CheY-like chemotaxis protein
MRQTDLHIEASREPSRKDSGWRSSMTLALLSRRLLQRPFHGLVPENFAGPNTDWNLIEEGASMACVLIADRDRNLQAIFRSLLADYGYDVEIADDGIECMQKLRDSRPELLIIDLHLPWGGGDGVLAAMRDELALRQVPVVLSAREGFLDKLVGLASASVVKMVIKPFSRSSILEVVRLAIARRTRILRHDFARPRRNGESQMAADGRRTRNGLGHRGVI